MPYILPVTVLVRHLNRSGSQVRAGYKGLLLLGAEFVIHLHGMHQPAWQSKLVADVVCLSVKIRSRVC